MSRSLLLAMALAVAGPAAAAAPAAAPAPDQVTVHTLANGLKIVVWPDHDIPNVALYTFYRVGARNEHPGITGISHYFEHMMFNGTSTRAPGEFDREMEANGGSNNAYTSDDLTVYQDWFPRSALETIFDLEGDRMANLDFDPKVVESERGVVYSERRLRVDDDSFGALAEQMQATAYVAHPYQFPVIGWPSDIEGWTLEDLKQFYKTYYAPNNAVMFVVGDVQPAEIFALAEKHIGPIPAQPAPEAVTTVEPEQKGERRLVLRKEGAQAPVLAMAWHVPKASDPKYVATEVLMSILAGGESSRLHQRLVERDQSVLDIGESLHRGFDPGLAWLFASLPPDGDLAKVEAAIDQELARIRKDGPTEAELAKARKQAVASFWRGMTTISGKAQALGSYEVFHGGWEQLFTATARYDAVTADDVRQAAARLVPDNRTVGTLVPAATP